MATFARPTFSAKAYAAFRPTYPASLFRTVLDYHQLRLAGNGTTLVDIGCGHGLIARALSPHFQHLVALDPSAGMVKQARQMTEDPKISFHQGRAEDLSPFVRPTSVDLAVAGQAAHWFDYSAVWSELARAMKPGGTVVFWGYVDGVLLGAENATAVMEKFVYGFGDVAPGIEGMAPYWEQPGRNILRGLLGSVDVPGDNWKDVTRITHKPGDPDGDSVAWLKKKMTLGEVEAYTRTFSCYSGWKDAHPEMKSRAEGGDGDVVDVMWDHMIDSTPEWKAMGGQWREAEVINDWGTYIIMARKK
ncbi:S-adenosyl-L-methionine-dependent methyltransferase [Xylaria bambusicola]|uniref:S-adenosyl-L-methionine-dependent methyltransferase n=1 Tax=Xylaria bambusicola TaxID=326684 RepID=UPI0020072927|nr:S-adenosyl-L-methionine-dependent methyltransferase [Xylaria bambusicola]KAI0506544.1 S-adenosyl-L-methionine-dependent methyltransferase [Xylaria bambusicola]